MAALQEADIVFNNFYPHEIFIVAMQQDEGDEALGKGDFLLGGFDIALTDFSRSSLMRDGERYDPSGYLLFMSPFLLSAYKEKKTISQRLARFQDLWSAMMTLLLCLSPSLYTNSLSQITSVEEYITFLSKESFSKVLDQIFVDRPSWLFIHKIFQQVLISYTSLDSLIQWLNKELPIREENNDKVL